MLSTAVRSFAGAGTAEDEQQLGWVGREDVRSGQLVLQFGVNFLATFSGINSDAVMSFLEAFDDGLRLCLEGLNSFLHGFRVIVGPAAGLAALGHAVNEGLRGAVEVDEVPDDNLISELLFELVPVLLVAGEAVKQVPAVAVC